MRKLILSIIALTLCAGLWAETQSVNYIDADGQEKTVTATVVTNETTTLNAGWYVVLGSDVQTRTLVCNGDVHLILADETKLTASGDGGGIQVSGGSNSLTIYGQSAQSGQLIAFSTKSASAGIGGGFNMVGSNITINGGKVTANGGNGSAGIGGGTSHFGSNITINGGTVTATGGGSGAGIGGGSWSYGTNITINGGTVTATGGLEADGIGNGLFDVEHRYFSNNIKVVASSVVKADNQNPPTAEIADERTDTTDIAKAFFGKRYVTIIDPLPDTKSSAIAEINAAINGVADADILAIATTAITNIGNAITVKAVVSIKTIALTDISAALLAKGKVNAIAEIDAAIKDLTLFPSEIQYIDDRKASINEGVTMEMINSEKQRTFDYIALHNDKLTAIAEVKTAMEYLAESNELYNHIGCQTIEAATDADKIIEAKTAALAKLSEVKALCEDVYVKGQAAALGTMGEPCTSCTAVKVTKGEKEVILYAPDKVEYIIKK